MTNVYRQTIKRAGKIKDLDQGLLEIGKIKIGMLDLEKRQSRAGGEWQMPVKIGYFRVTTMERGPDGNFLLNEQAHEALGPEPTSLPIMLPFNDPVQNFFSSYVAYKGTTLFCSGDGEVAERRETPNDPPRAHKCTCPMLASGECLEYGRLQVILNLPGMPSVGGVFMHRTKSLPAIRGLYSSMAIMSAYTGGRLAGIPMELRVVKAAAEYIDKTGARKKTNVARVVLLADQNTLQESARQLIETESRMTKLIDMAPAQVDDDEADDLRDELYPETGPAAA